MGLQFEFDSGNKVLLLRLGGVLTDELMAKADAEFRRYAIATDARADIVDVKFVTEHRESSGLIRQLATQAPAILDNTRPRFIVADSTAAYGLARMFQIVAEEKRPLVKVVRTMDEALEELGVKSPHFESLE